MPTYEYACRSCEKHFEQFQAFTDDPLTVCPTCGGELRKVFGNVGIVLKGSGFYKNDSRTDSSRSTATAKSSSSESSSETSKSSDASDTKTDATPKDTTTTKEAPAAASKEPVSTPKITATSTGS